jgi:galactonate dehydratase
MKGVERLIATFRESVGDNVDILLDLNFNFKTEGNIQVARALEPYNLMWLELDCYDAVSLQRVTESTSTPICSGEDLYTLRGYIPYFERRAMHTASIDIMWNGLAQSKKIADTAEACEMNVAPHNHYSPLSSLISMHFCCVTTNVRIFEIDVDDVAWATDLITTPLVIKDGYLERPTGPGWGADLNEELLQKHPWQ